MNWALFVSDHNFDNDCYSANPTKNKPNFVTPNFTNNGVPPSDFIEKDKWYFIASSYDGISTKYYQIEMDLANHVSNISPNYTEVNTGGLGNSNYDIYIGATQNPPFPYWFNGAMDELILFNRALTNTEAQSVYDYLFGYTNSIPESKNKRNIVVITKGDNCIITTDITSNFSYEIYNAVGQVIAKKK